MEGVDACLWVGSPGAVGFNSVGKALTGEVNPSGRLTDIYAYDLTTAPAYYNAGSFTYGNSKPAMNRPKRKKEQEKAT